MSRCDRRATGVTLFPFLNVLVCAMGVVIVIMAGQTLISLESGHDQVVRIVGDAKGRTPSYVECRSHEVQLHPDGPVVSAEALALGDSLFHDLLSELDRYSREKYLVLLVRPDGIDTFEKCLSAAEARGLSLGKDALLPGGRLIFREDGPMQAVESGANR